MIERTAGPLTLRPADQHAVSRFLLSVPPKSGVLFGNTPANAHRSANAELTVDQPGGGQLSYEISIVDSTTDRVGVLIGTFMYDAAPCTLVLRTPDGEELWLRGRIDNCIFISGRIHIVGIALESPVDVASIIEI
ncbi:MAG: hypothetical protein AAGH64_11440 [Planctomycetota bacterium]